ncbi:hypothetical protein [Saccharothrix variisporea]|uniref:hypothetical protein n=1 Tax=Saccharothrix variisporea TaxID=543527 RepID=UPI0014768CBF|nr:hypothetical protein [Saccharothrix variisporea]
MALVVDGGATSRFAGQAVESDIQNPPIVSDRRAGIHDQLVWGGSGGIRPAAMA